MRLMKAIAIFTVIAGLFGFEPSQFLETPEDEKETPKVSFDF